jgi:hypothetical protein
MPLVTTERMQGIQDGVCDEPPGVPAPCSQSESPWALRVLRGSYELWRAQALQPGAGWHLAQVALAQITRGPSGLGEDARRRGPKSRMRETRTSGSVRAPEERSSGATRQYVAQRAGFTKSG